VYDSRVADGTSRSDQPGAIARRSTREVSGSRGAGRSVRSAGRWQPPEGVGPDEIRRVIAAAATERDRLLMRALWATGGRVSEVRELRARDVRRDALVMPNRKNPSRPVKTVFMPAGQADLPGALLLWARDQGLADDEPLFYSRKRGADGRRQPLGRQQIHALVTAASARAGVEVLAVRAAPSHGKGDPAPVHPHLFRHARVRQTLRATRNLAIVQKQAGWSRLQMAYLTVGDDEVRAAMQDVAE
jgi:integrase